MQGGRSLRCSARDPVARQHGRRAGDLRGSEMDVMKVAAERRENLQREAAKLDEFIRMAESLIDSSRHSGHGDNSALTRVDFAKREQAG